MRERKSKIKKGQNICIPVITLVLLLYIVFVDDDIGDGDNNDVVLVDDGANVAGQGVGVVSVGTAAG